MENTKKELEEINNQIFYLRMIDHWTREDYELSDKLESRKRELEAML